MRGEPKDYAAALAGQQPGGPVARLLPSHVLPLPDHFSDQVDALGRVIGSDSSRGGTGIPAVILPRSAHRTYGRITGTPVSCSGGARPNEGRAQGQQRGAAAAEAPQARHRLTRSADPIGRWSPSEPSAVASPGGADGSGGGSARPPFWPSGRPGVRPFIRASGRPSGRTPAVAVCILAARGPGGGRSCGLRALRGERMHDALRPPLRLLLARPLLHKPSIFTGGGDLKSAMNVDRCRSHARCLQNKRGNAIGARWGWELGLGKGPKQGAETSSVAPDWRCSSAAN